MEVAHIRSKKYRMYMAQPQCSERSISWPLSLQRGGHCRESKIRVNVWTFRLDKKVTVAVV